MGAKDKTLSIIYYSGDSYSSFVINHLNNIKHADVFVFYNTTLPTICFEDELECKTRFIKEFSSLSREFNALVVASCATSLQDVEEASALIFDKGKLIGVSEEIVDARKVGGISVSFYDVDFGRIGVFVSENTKQIEFFQLAYAYDVDMLFSFIAESDKKISNLCANYASAIFGENIVCFSKNRVSSFCKNVKHIGGKKIISLDVNLKQRINFKKYVKHIHKSIYTSMQEKEDGKIL